MDLAGKHTFQGNSEFRATNVIPSSSGVPRDRTLNVSTRVECRVGDLMSMKLMGPPSPALVNEAIIPHHGVVLAL